MNAKNNFYKIAVKYSIYDAVSCCYFPRQYECRFLISAG